MKFHFSVEKGPRILTHFHSLHPSPLVDVILADTRSFPQEAVQFVERNHDLLEDHGIFPEYEPLIGLSQNYHYRPELMPQEVQEIYQLILDQLDPPLLEIEI